MGVSSLACFDEQYLALWSRFDVDVFYSLHILGRCLCTAHINKLYYISFFKKMEYIVI
jgi:hypothetical protein